MKRTVWGSFQVSFKILQGSAKSDCRKDVFSVASLFTSDFHIRKYRAKRGRNDESLRCFP